MDLNEHHYQNIVSYLKFARYRRAQQIRSVDGNFEDFIESKVREDETYNGDEVEDILKVTTITVSFNQTLFLSFFSSLICSLSAAPLFL